MLTRTKQDKQKARSLVNTAKVTLERLKEFDLEKYPSNTLTDLYEIIRKLMEALSCLEGVKFKGDGAHAELIDHICKKYNFSEAERVFLQDMRDYRNRISYEGFTIRKEYIHSNSGKIEKIIKNLLDIIKKEL